MNAHISTFTTLWQTKIPPTSRHSFHTSANKMAQEVDSRFIHEVTKKENQLTGQAEPVKGGPTAHAQKHVGQQLDGDVVSDITKGETKITQRSGPVPGGPAAFAEREATQSGSGTQVRTKRGST